MQRLIHIVDGEALNGHGRRHNVDGEMRGIDGDETFGRGEPQAGGLHATIRQTNFSGTPCRRMSVGSHFAATQTIGSTKLDPVRAGIRAEAGGIATRDAIAGGEPEMPQAVVENGVNGSMIRPSSHRMKNALVPEIPSAILGSDEHSAIRSREQGCNDVA